MSAVDQHAEAHRLRSEDGYGARKIGQALGISRHAATLLLARPLPQPVDDPVAAEEPPVAEPGPVPAADPTGVAADRLPLAEQVAELAAERRPVGESGDELVAQQRPVAEPVAGVAAARQPVAEPVGHVTGVVRLPLPGASGPWLRIDLSDRPSLLRDLVRLARVGLRIPYIVDLAIRSFAAAYWEAVTGGHLAPGQPYEIHTRVRPRRAA